MSKLCKCTHDKTDHSREKWYKDRHCDICNCKEVIDQKNKSYMIGSIIVLGIAISFIGILSMTIFGFVDTFNSTPDQSAMIGHTIEESYEIIMTLFIGGLVLGGIIAHMIWTASRFMAKHLRPIKAI